MSLPDFRYHPDPIASGSIKASPAACDCCGHSRGFEYTSSLYTRHRPKPTICPWCIKSGEAAQKYEASFSDDYPLRQAGIGEEIIMEVCKRTPSYNSWQQENWQSHCDDACEFHGDAEPAELRGLSDDAVTQILRLNGMRPEHWRSLLDRYQKGGNPAVYKFLCRHCDTPIYSIDLT